MYIQSYRPHATHSYYSAVQLTHFTSTTNKTLDNLVQGFKQMVVPNNRDKIKPALIDYMKENTRQFKPTSSSIAFETTTDPAYIVKIVRKSEADLLDHLTEQNVPWTAHNNYTHPFDSDTHLVIIDKLDTQSLREKLPDLNLKDRLKITEQLFELVGQMHQPPLSCCHKDFNRGNVFLDEDNTIQLIDFGKGCLIDELPPATKAAFAWEDYCSLVGLVNCHILDDSVCTFDKRRQLMSELVEQYETDEATKELVHRDLLPDASVPKYSYRR